MLQPQEISLRQFKDINVHDTFFDSLRNSYQGFNDWFLRKSNEIAYLMEDQGAIQAFLYLKTEYGPVTDIHPPLNTSVCLKVGTFKINGHGTRLGERFVKKIFDHAISNNIFQIYVTVFPHHRPLINILERYGFRQYGTKQTPTGEELVFIKDFSQLTGNVLFDYPVVNGINSRIWLMSIYPQWHTKLFPDSILRTENSSIIQDVSHTNSINKVYIGWMNGMENICPNDIIIIYRSIGSAGRPWYQSVITSICTVTESFQISNFQSLKQFQDHARPHSVFSDAELENFYRTKPHGQLIKMTYNIALPKRLNMQQLVENVGLNRTDYWGFRSITKDQLLSIFQQSNIAPCAMIL